MPDNSSKTNSSDKSLLLRLAGLSSYSFFLQNLHVDTDCGVSDVDLVMLNESGIYLIKSVDIGGWVSGKEGDTQWTFGPADNTSSIDNPVIESSRITKAVASYLDVDEKSIRSYCVTHDDCRFRDFKGTGFGNCRLVPLNEFRTAVKAQQINSGVFSRSEIEDIYSLLTPLCEADEEKRKARSELAQNEFQNKMESRTAGPVKRARGKQTQVVVPNWKPYARKFIGTLLIITLLALVYYGFSHTSVFGSLDNNQLSWLSVKAWFSDRLPVILKNIIPVKY